MTHTDYTKEILNIKDNNIYFDENCFKICKIDDINTKIFHGYLTYTPECCDVCGVINESNNDIIKWNWKRNCKIKMTKVANYNTILLLDKQRFYCKHCHHTFIAKTNVVGFHKQVSNDTELSIKLELMNKISEKDISKHFNVSHNKVNRIMHELSRKTVLPGILPTIMNFDEFKATKNTIGKMAFIITDNKNHKTFDILESRKSNYLKKYFYRFPRKQRLAVKFIIIDLFGPYYDLFKSIFPNATIISDRFHIVAQANNAFKCTRVQIMKKDKKNYKKLKHYWKLLQKCELDLDNKKKKYSNYFKREITEYDIVQYLINTNKILKETYNIYQGIIKAIRNKDSNLFIKIIESKHNNISEYMKTTLKTYKKFKIFIINSLKYNYNNGLIEGTNNLIKCIKRIAFGYKSFSHFKTRILLITGIYKIAY
jgi:transposase